jgi:hypothetical protein
MPSIADVIARHAPERMKIPGVVGGYEGETSGRRVIRVMVVERTRSRRPASSDR